MTNNFMKSWIAAILIGSSGLGTAMASTSGGNLPLPLKKKKIQTEESLLVGKGLSTVSQKKHSKGGKVARTSIIGSGALRTGAGQNSVQNGTTPLGYRAALVQNVANGVYSDLGTSGTVIATANTDDANSAPTPIGFPFVFRGVTFTEFILNTNGFIKLGNEAPSAANLFTAPSNAYTGGVVYGGAAADTNIISVFNHDLHTSTIAAAEYRVATVGAVGEQVCTIQFKNVKDKPTGFQYDNMEFQIRLYEGSNKIEFVYGNFVASTAAPAFKTVGVGLRGANNTAADQVLIGRKNSGDSWNITEFAYVTAGDATLLLHNCRNNVLPGVGRTYTFNPQPAIDVQTLGIAGASSGCNLTATNDIKVYVENPGSQVALSVPVFLDVNGTISEGTIDNLAAGAVDSITFSGIDFSTIGSYNIQAYTKLADDGFLGNDTVVNTISNLQPNNLATPYVNSFETDEDLLGANLFDVNNDGFSWFVTPQALPNVPARTGTNLLVYSYNTASATTGANDWLISRCFDLQAGDQYKVSFYYRSRYDAANPFAEKMQLAIGTDATPAGMTTTLIDLPNIVNNTYQLAEQTFTVPTSGTYYLGLKANSDADKWLLMVDDLELKKVSNVDVGVVSIVSPMMQEFGCYGAAQTVAVAVKNYGVEATNIPVELTVTGAATQTLTEIMPILAAGATDTVIFTTTLDMVALGDYFISAKTTMAGDTDPSNDGIAVDTFTVKSSVAVPYAENFNGVAEEELPAGWVSGKSGKQEFIVVATPSMGVAGSPSLYVNLYDYDDPATDQTYAELASPRFSGVTPTQYLSFDHKLTNWTSNLTGSGVYNMIPTDSLNILYSTDCGATFQLLTSINSSNYVSAAFYQKLRFPLSAINATGDVIFRFVGKHDGTGDAQGNARDYIHSIDNLVIGDVPLNDISVVSLSSNARYTITPVSQLPPTGFQLAGRVTNNGLNEATLVNATLKVAPTSFEQTVSFPTMASGASEPLVFANAFIPTGAGDYVATLKATSAETDGDTVNNSFTLPLAVSDSTMARDAGGNGGAGIGIGAGTANGIFQKYELRVGVPDTLTSVTFWIGDIDEPTTVKAMIFRANTAGGINATAAPLDSTVALTVPVSGANQFYTLSFRKPSGLGYIMTAATANGSRYFIGLREKQGNMRLGFGPTLGGYTTNDVLIRLNGAWSDAATFGISSAFYIRPNFGPRPAPVVGLPSKFNNSLNVVAYPNPTDGILNLSYDRNEVAPVSVKVLNLMGAVVAEINEASELAGDRVSLNLAGQAAGTYIVQITTDKHVVTRKVVLTR